MNMEDYKEQDKKQRDDFVKFWANYVKTHSDKDWSKQQNILINSVLKSATQLPREKYLELKKKVKLLKNS